MAQARGTANPNPKRAKEAGSALRALIESADAQCPFGPLFFLTQLRGFVRDHCPDAAEALPMVELLLHTGETLRVCHTIGVAPRYVVLAVYSDSGSEGSHTMRTEFLPYELIVRVTIRTERPTGAPFGFSAAHPPIVMSQESAMTPEEALRAAAAEPLSSATRQSEGKRIR